MKNHSMSSIFGIIGLLFPLIQGLLATDICKYIQVSGAVYHKNTNGVYSLHDEIHCNGRPAWEDAAGRNYLYYLLDGYDGWMIAPTSCYHWGNFRITQKTDAEVPFEADGTWKEFCPEEGAWKNSTSVQITCLTGADYTPPPPGPSTTPDLELPSSTDYPEIYICKEDSCTKGAWCNPDSFGTYECVCLEGYSGKDCTVPVGHSTLTAIVIVVIFAGAVSITLFAIFLFIRLRGRQVKSVRSQDSPEHSMFKYKPLDEFKI